MPCGFHGATPGCKPESAEWTGLLDAPGPCHWKCNYSFFTFVRDPVERFGSGLFENAYRASQSNYSTCASQAAAAVMGLLRLQER